ncbi:MAG: DNA-processing protein DprA, partial [Dehalococcoidia bacterium]|nr:DNA-processing protein DprA [Dehalococcoidia bacterium]
MEELAFWVAVSRVSGIGRVRLRRLREYFGTLEHAWSASPEILKHAGLDLRTVERFCDARRNADPGLELEKLKRHGIDALTCEDSRYPRRLLEVSDCPAVLYVRGRLPDDDAPLLAVVGTRGPTQYGKQVAAELVEGLVEQGIVIVSGLARGIDTVAHRETLKRGGTTMAVLASGLDLVYPGENLNLAQEIRQSGALVSEHPPGVKPRVESFPMRNRIMSGLSLGVLVVEAGERSGALITAHQAVDQNREVFAVPGSIFSSQSKGSNHLIQSGEAKLVTCPADVLEELDVAWRIASPVQSTLAQADSVQMRLLAEMGATPVHSDALGRQLGLPSHDVSAALALL